MLERLDDLEEGQHDIHQGLKQLQRQKHEACAVPAPNRGPSRTQASCPVACASLQLMLLCRTRL